MTSGAAHHTGTKKMRYKQKRNAFTKGILEFKFSHLTRELYFADLETDRNAWDKSKLS